MSGPLRSGRDAFTMHESVCSGCGLFLQQPATSATQVAVAPPAPVRRPLSDLSLSVFGLTGKWFGPTGRASMKPFTVTRPRDQVSGLGESNGTAGGRLVAVMVVAALVEGLSRDDGSTSWDGARERAVGARRPRGASWTSPFGESAAARRLGRGSRADHALLHFLHGDWLPFLRQTGEQPTTVHRAR